MNTKVVKVNGWREGFNKVGSSKLIREYCGYSIKDAKECTDKIMSREVITFEFSDSAVAEAFRDKMIGLGATVQLDESNM